MSRMAGSAQSATDIVRVSKSAVVVDEHERAIFTWTRACISPTRSAGQSVAAFVSMRFFNVYNRRPSAL